MDIGAILSRAWQIIWRNKVLWIFGILAGCSSTNYLNNNVRYTYESDRLPPPIQNFFNNLTDAEVAVFVAIVLVVVFVLTVVAIFLGTMGRVGLIRGTMQAERGAARFEFGELFSGSLPFFWRVFLLNLLVGLAFAAAIIITTIGLVVTLVGIICLIPLVCLLIPLGWIVNIIVEQASIAIVVENLGIMDGLRRGWEVVRNNLGSIIVMGLILGLGVSLIGGTIIGLPLFAIAGPALLGWIAGTDTSFYGGLALAGLCFVAYLPVLIVLNGILRGFIESSWTLTFLRLTSPPAAIEPVDAPVE